MANCCFSALNVKLVEKNTKIKLLLYIFIHYQADNPFEVIE